MEKPSRPRTSTSRTELSSVTSVTMSFIGSFETYSLVVREARASMGSLDDVMSEIECGTGKAVSTRERPLVVGVQVASAEGSRKTGTQDAKRVQVIGAQVKLETQAAKKLVEEKSPVCFQNKTT
ncbi:hypothetical protein L6452_41838 [Arctium lappa]|uniref:Uncharacterized protein n=1 Tax=Arctium lappa TaxID=4217 RepID=A0ACB8XHS4_ARCLA|nr:hypothetical protein L6452_41838 [Arctium lappa]